MIMFNCDYNEGCCPEIMEEMIRTNMEQHEGYSEDKISAEAKELIKKVCEREDVDVHILVGGTQTNMTVIAASLRPYQGVITPATGHIARHETGAIEAHGHKVLALPETDGKISAEQIDKFCADHYKDESFEHIVQPGMVYISSPTELGTVYKRAEIEAIRKVCDKYDLILFLDGARLGYGLACDENDLDIPFLAKTCDVFYIGGTKQGALMGEAVVIANERLKKDFRYMIKQNGGMFAKGRLLGLQFKVLMQDDLYMKYSRHAIAMAKKIIEGFADAGIQRFSGSPTNQQFFVMEDGKACKLAEKYGFSTEGWTDDTHRIVRFCTSWATKEENVDKLLADIKGLA